MDETDTTEPDVNPEDVQDAEETQPAPNRLWVFALLGAGFLVLAIGFVLNSEKPNDQFIAVETTEAQKAYHTILSEMRTGVRLVRLEDFITEHPNSRHILAARAQRSALKTNEEMAWSKLTDRLFDIDGSPETKQIALNEYTDAWGSIVRSEKLEELTASDEEDDGTGFKPIKKKSRFAGGGDAGDLVGAPIVRQSRPQIRINPPSTRDKRDKVVDARIRTKKSPTYPRSARRKKIPGTVTLSLDIDRRGRVVDTRVISVEARRYKRDFVRAAERAAKRTRFYPKTINGKAVTMRGYVQRYSFKVSR
jgi:TonB family protein